MDNYKRQALIGTGSFGRVYKAIDKAAGGTVVALKIIGKRGRTAKEIANLRGECQIQRHLQHPNIIRMLHSFETADEIVVVTEFAQSDLHKLLISKRCIPEQRAQRLTHDLVSALYYLHSHRILHRDLKPQNILLDGAERAMLCDFGLARNMTMGTHVLTSIKGTPLYMAPELMSNKPYDQQADLWSLGCIIYETMAGQTPFCTTSMINLMHMIQHTHVCWPSFLSDACISFLKGLLEKDPTERLSWAAILEHPFVRGHVHVGDGRPLPGSGAVAAPLTHPLSQSQHLAKEKQLNNLTKMVSQFRPQTVMERDAMREAAAAGGSLHIGRAAAELHSSQDSVHAILQSDIENLETDVEDDGALFMSDGRLPVAGGGRVMQGPLQGPQLGQVPPPMALVPLDYDFSKLCFVSGNANLIVNNMQDNFAVPEQQATEFHGDPAAAVSVGQRPVNRDLERRKLSQNLDNFSLRMSTTATKENRKEANAVEGKDTIPPPPPPATTSLSASTPPSLRPGWDSCDEYQNPPIENDEWQAFLHRSMQEVLDGEWDALRQQNLLSVIVAPLRNGKASVRVVECVAQLLSLPLVLPVAGKDLADIKSAYFEVKLVPNLVYASKLLCTSKTGDVPPHSDETKTVSYKSGAQLVDAERRTLLALYELIGHLVHLGDEFLTQFCDAVAILSVGPLLASLLPTGSAAAGTAGDPTVVRLSSALLGVLAFALREQPENAELIEQIVLLANEGVALGEQLTAVRNERLRMRWCRMLRMVGRFSCRTLQRVWTAEMRTVLERWQAEGSETERGEAQKALKEFMHMPFY